MKSKFLSFLIYVIFGSVALIVIANTQDGEVFNILKIAGFIAILLCILICFFIFIFCAVDNSKINKYLDADNYQELLVYARKMNTKNLFFIKERHRYYKYLILLCYLELDLDNNIEKNFDEFTLDDLFIYPVIYYWKACFFFSKGKFDNIEELYQAFNVASDVKRRYNVYENISLVFNCLYYYINNEIDKLKEANEVANWSKVSIPATKRCKEMIDIKINETINSEKQITI